MEFCPEDGYPVRVYNMSEKSLRRCSNFWHPHHPGECPACGSKGFHMPFSSKKPKRAKCARCDHIWEPDVPTATS